MDNNLQCICLNEDVFIMIQIFLNFVPKGPIINESALVQVMDFFQPIDSFMHV